MRISNLSCSFALLALTVASSATAATVDPSNDFDCATAFQFAYRMAVTKRLEADLQEQTLIMNAWFAEKWDHEHPGDAPKQLDHYSQVLKALPDDPKGTIETLKAYSRIRSSLPSFLVTTRSVPLNARSSSTPSSRWYPIAIISAHSARNAASILRRR